MIGWVGNLALGILVLALQDPSKPHGEVNDVCWKLLGIAGVGYTILGGVITLLGKKLWEQMTGRLEDRERHIDRLEKKKNEGSDPKLRKEG